MSDVRPSVIAVVSSDWHISDKPPIARSCEKDWFEVQRCAIEQVLTLCQDYDCPLLLAGDIFDKWKQPPETITFLINMLREFPRVLAVPGNHDLPNHQYDDRERSAYHTLECAEVLTTIHPHGYLRLTEDILVYGFPCGYQPPCKMKENKNLLSIALIHDYIWITDADYPGAPIERRFDQYNKKLKGFDLACFGDNHTGFCCDRLKRPLINCGTLLRRKMNEKDYEPMVGLIYDDGSIEDHKLDCSEDKFIDIDQGLSLIESALDMTEVISSLSELADQASNFIDAVHNWMEKNGIKGRLRKLIQDSLTKKEDRP